MNIKYNKVNKKENTQITMLYFLNEIVHDCDVIAPRLRNEK